MGYAKHVGRVGALAVALGVGAAVGAMPGLAWAVPDADSASGSAESPQNPPSGPNGKTDTAAPPVSPSTPSDSVGANTGTDSVSVVPQSDPSSQTTVTVGAESSPPVKVSATGGANTTVADDQSNGTIAADPAAGTGSAAPSAGKASPTATTSPKPGHKGGGSNKVATDRTRPERPATSGTGDASVAEEPSQLATQSAAPAAEAVSESYSPLSIFDSALPPADTIAVSAEPLESDASTTLRTTSIATSLLAAAGLGPSGANTPSTPAAPPPTAALVLAWQRRQIREELAAESSTTNLQATDTILVEPSLAASSLTARAPKPPKPPKPGTGPNQPPTTAYNPGDNTTVDGQVFGHLHATDPNHDTLTYRASGLDPGATFQVTTPDGQFVYTPSPQAQPDSSDAFTVTVSDIGDAGFRLKGKQATNHTATVPVTVTVPADNEAPVVTDDPTVGSPNSDGVIIGQLNVIDPDSVLVYDVTAEPTYGSVIVDPATGTYTYTPSAEARLQAALTTATVETDTFTVSVTDGLHTPVEVTVRDVLVAELPTNSVIATVNVGDGPTAVVTSPDGLHTYVANTDADTVTVLDASTNAVITTIDVGDSPVALAVSPDSAHVYTANSVGNSVTVIDAINNSVSDTIEIGAEPTGIAVSPSGPLVYTSNTNGTITIINTDTREVSPPIPVDPSSIVLNQDGSRLYALNSDTGIVTVLDTTDNTELGTVHVGPDPYGIAISPSGSYVYVTNTGDDTVSIIDTADLNAEPEKINVGDQPRGIDVTPNGLRIYVANYGDDTVSIIDANTHTVFNIPVSNGPSGIDIINDDGTTATITHPDFDIVTVLLLTGNDPPVVAPSLNDPNPAGVIVGNVNATDAEGDSLTYSVDPNATSGNAVVDPATGEFTYTPDAAARHAAAATSGMDSDSFTVIVDDNHGQQTAATITVEITPQNESPTVDPDPQGAADGTVFVDFNADDPDGDSLTYTITSAPTLGSITRSGADQFTYTPSDAARTAAAASLGPDSDMFTVRIDDGHGGQVTSTVIVVVAPAGVVGQPTVGGLPSDGVVFSLNGSRAVQVSSVGSGVQVVVIDSGSGLQVGDPVSLSGSSLGGTAFNADGSRVAVLTSQSGGSGTTSYVTIIDTGSGEQVGSTVEVAGDASQGVQFSPDPVGGKAVVSTVVSDNQAGTLLTYVTVVDGDTGALIGTTEGVTGTSIDSVKFSLDGDRAYQTATLIGPNNVLETRIVVVDTATGAQVGEPLFLAGAAAGGLQLFDDGDRALQTIDTRTGATPTRIYTIDMTTATVIGDPIELAGSPAGIPDGNAVLSDDGTRAVQLMLEGSTTRVVVIDTATGTVISSDTTVSGQPFRSARFSDDGSRVVVTTRTTSGGGGPGGPPSTTTRVAVVDVASGDQVGSTYTVTAALRRDVQFSPDGTRLVLVTGSFGSANADVTVLDAETGLVVGAPVPLGGADSGMTFSEDGSRLLVTTFDGTTTKVTAVDLVDASSASVSLGTGVPVGALAIGSDGQTGFQTMIVDNAATPSTRLVAVDISDAPTLGDVITIDGASTSFGDVRSTLDATRLFVTTSTTGPDTTTVTIIDPIIFVAAPAGILGQTTEAGVPIGGSSTLSPDGTRAVQFISDGSGPASVVIVDTRTGLQVGDAITLPTSSAGRIAFSPNGSRLGIVGSQFVGGSTTSYLTIIDTSTGAQVGDSVPVTGDSFMGVQFSPDGSTAAMSTVDSATTTSVTLVDAVTGALIGTTPGVTGTSIDSVKFSLDGDRAYQTATLIGPNNVLETRVVAIDTASGEQVGDTLLISGGAAGGLQLFATGTRALQTVYTTDSGQTTTHVYTINLETVAVVGDPLDISGSPAGPPEGAPVLNTGGTRAVQLTSDGSTTRVVVIDTAMSTVISSATTLTGSPSTSAQFSPDGSKIFATTGTFSGGGSTTYVSVIDTETGIQIGTSATVLGSSGDLFVSPNGSRIAAIGTSFGPGTASNQIVVINTSTGGAVGSPVVVAGQLMGTVLTPDGSRLLVTTFDGTTSRVTAVSTVDGSSAGSVSLGTGVAVGPLAVGSDGKTGFQTLMITDPATNTESTRVAIVDVSGVPSVVGVIALDGAFNSGDAQSTLNGTRVVVTTASGNNSTTVTVIDTAPFLVDPATTM